MPFQRMLLSCYKYYCTWKPSSTFHSICNKNLFLSTSTWHSLLFFLIFQEDFCTFQSISNYRCGLFSIPRFFLWFLHLQRFSLLLILNLSNQCRMRRCVSFEDFFSILWISKIVFLISFNLRPCYRQWLAMRRFLGLVDLNFALLLFCWIKIDSYSRSLADFQLPRQS